MCGKRISIEKVRQIFFSKFPNSELEIIEELPGGTQSILVKDKYGFCKIRKQHLLNGVTPTITTALNILDYFSCRANEIHNFKYDYSLVEYKTSFSRVKIICKKHGIFTQVAHWHLHGQGCSKCGDERVSAYQSNNPSGWTPTNWENKASYSKNFDSFKVYIVECWNNDEHFYKIGRTFKKTNTRFNNNIVMPYNFTLIKEITGTANEIYKKESMLKKFNKENKYIPRIKFDGVHECFSKLNTNLEYL